MKKIFTLFVIIICSVQVKSQFCMWERQVNVDNQNRKVYCTFDQSGNCYMTGYFYNFGDFDTIHYSYNYNHAPVYIVKYDPAGKMKWVVVSSGYGGQPTGICVDQHGHIYVSGDTEDTLTFGSHTVINDVGIGSPFIVKLDTSGNVLWLKSYHSSFASTTALYINTITADINDNVYFGAYLYIYNNNTLIMDNDTVNGIDGSVVIGKIDSSANTNWIRQFIPISSAQPLTISQSPGQGLIVGGTIGNSSGWYLDTCMVGSDSIISHGYTDIFIMNLDFSGNPIWAKDYGDAGNNSLRSLGSDAAGNLYLVRLDYWGSPFPFSICKLNSNGQLIWSRPSTHLSDMASTVAPNGDMYCYMSFPDSMSFNGIQQISPGYNTLLARLDSSGAFVWQRIIQNAYTYQSDITSGDRGNILLAQTRLFNGVRIDNNMLLNQYDGMSLFYDTLYDQNRSSKLTGKIYSDSNSNCQSDSTEQLFPYFSVVAMPGPCYSYARANGEYIMNIDSGNFQVSPVIPFDHAAIYSPVCSTQYSVHLNSNDSIGGNDFAFNKGFCELFNITSNFNDLLLCSSVVHWSLDICNTSLDSSAASTLTIKYPHVVPLSSSIPWSSFTQSDSTMIINLPALASDSCLTINFTDSIICDSIIIDYVNFLAPFMWTSTITPMNSCYAGDSIYFMNTLEHYYDGPIMVKEISENHISIYPNPSTGKILFSYESDSGPVLMKIFDMQGRVVFTNSYQSGENNEADVSDLQDGLYIVLLTGDSFQSSSRLIMQRN